MKMESPCSLLRRGLSYFWKGVPHEQDHHPGVSRKEAGGPLSLSQEERHTTIEAELDYALARLYEKTVPPTVREFLEDTGSDGDSPQNF